jgi:hypothetical protein
VRGRTMSWWCGVVFLYRQHSRPLACLTFFHVKAFQHFIFLSFDYKF